MSVEGGLRDCPRCRGRETAVLCVGGYYSCTECGHDFGGDKRERVPKYSYYSTSEAGLGFFYVRGGPFASEQMMGIHIRDEGGFTVAVSCDRGFAEAVVRSAEGIEGERARCCADLCDMCARGFPATYGPMRDGMAGNPPLYEFWHHEPSEGEWQRSAHPCKASKIRLRVRKEEEDARRDGAAVPGGGSQEG